MIFIKQMPAAIYHLTLKSNSATLTEFTAAYIAENIFAHNWTEIAKADETMSALIKLYCKNKENYNNLKNYDRDSLYLWLATNWNLDNERYLPYNNSCWAYKYDANSNKVLFDGFISRKNEYETSSGKPYPISIPECGNKLYTPSIIVEAATAHLETRIHNGLSTANHTNGDNAVRRMVNESEQYQSIKKRLKNLYDEFAIARGGIDKAKNLDYIWQWKISSEEYEKIKSALISEECKSQIKRLYKDNTRCLFLVIAYIAEHYKREWNGNDGEDVLAGIGLESSDSKELAIGYFGHKKQEDRVFKHEDGNHEWLYSIRMEGGLPINYPAIM